MIEFNKSGEALLASAPTLEEREFLVESLVGKAEKPSGIYSMMNFLNQSREKLDCRFLAKCLEKCNGLDEKIQPID